MGLRRMNARVSTSDLKARSASERRGSAGVIASFVKGHRGTAAVEIALVAVPFLAMIFEILQNAMFVYFSGALDQAAIASARQIMTGSAQNQSLTAAQFRSQILCPALPIAMSCNNIIVNLQTFSEADYPSGFYNFVNPSQTGIIVPPLDNTKTSFCPGSGGQYVYLQVFYAMPFPGIGWLPVVTTTFNGKTVRLVAAAAAFRNEPYQATSSPTYPGC
jgi:hypothetical protein